MDCAGCSFIPGRSFIVVGGKGGVADNVIARSTSDRLASSSVLTTGIAVANTITAIYTEGSLIILGYADDPAVATAASGGITVSKDGGANFTAASGPNVPVRAIVKLDGVYIAVGGTGAGAPVVYTSSDNATTWTASTSSVLTGTNCLTNAAVDYENSRAYIVGEGGTLLVGTVSGGSLSLASLTANLPGGPGNLLAVAVLDAGFVVVGGAAGYYAESKNGGVTWTQPEVPGSVQITSISGNTHRAVLTTSSQIFYRDVLVDNVYTLVTLANGASVSGNYTRVRMNREDDFNTFVAVTDAGEVVFAKAQHPWA